MFIENELQDIYPNVPSRALALRVSLSIAPTNSFAERSCFGLRTIQNYLRVFSNSYAVLLSMNHDVINNTVQQ